MSKVNCALCNYELEVPKGVTIPDECDVVCGDCGEDLENYLESSESEGKTIQ
jgi:hypothetical protein